MKQNNSKPVFVFVNCEGVSFNVFFKKPHPSYGADGLCFSPCKNTPKKSKIYISPELGQKTKLNVCIHEFTHAFFWDKTEKEVTYFANILTKFLYKNKWRQK